MAPVRLSALEPLLWAAGAVVLAVVPFALSTFQVVQITVFLIFCLLAVSLDLSWGLAGLLSFGQGAFFGLGGYVYAILPTMRHRARRSRPAPWQAGWSRACSAISRSTVG